MKLVMLLASAAFVLLGQEDEFRFGTTVVIPTGLEGKVYHISKFSKQLPDLEKKKPVGKIYTTSLNIPTQDFRAGFPGVTKRTEWFAIDYDGKFWIERPGPYTFALTSDDGSKLYIDDQMIVDNDGVHPTATKTGRVNLEPGTHRIRVSYFQGPGWELALVLEVEAPFMPRRVFNTDDYKPPATVESLPSKTSH
jgi:PA14 domain